MCHRISVDTISPCSLCRCFRTMADGRPLLFARKPAPVQIAWLAYPGTTGIDAIDYRLTDPRLDPPSHDSQYSECSVRLPDSF
jgi:protein O-GlcNAc transferase